MREIEQQRREAGMLPESQIEARGIRDPRAIAAIRSVPRAKFVPHALRAFAFEDRALDIGWGATISQPYIVASMTELLDIEPDHRVLEIGTGSGYQAAVLSLVAAEVCSLEVVPELAYRATALLHELGYDNVRVRLGDGYFGWPEEAPFDRIMLTAAPLVLPETLIQQLRPGGRLVAPVGRQDEQQLIVLDKHHDGHVESRVVYSVSFVPMVRTV
jgi:protein-L-isoaspartate(D-aspartate) O-methyltransferase